VKKKYSDERFAKSSGAEVGNLVVNS